MKTLEDIKQQYARENNFCEWLEILYSIDDPAEIDEHFDEVIKRYAREVAWEVLNNAYESSEAEVDPEDPWATCLIVRKDSIVNESNIPTL